MTGMLASVRTIEEADIVVKANVDVLDLKEPAHGALGALNITAIRQIVEKYSGHITISSTIGDIPFSANLIKPVVDSIATTGVDIIKIGVFNNKIGLELLDCLKNYKKNNIKIVLVFFVDKLFDYNEFVNILTPDTVYGVMLDTAHKDKGSLLDNASFESIHSFISAAKEKGFLTGLAGSLKSDDIEYLTPFVPDYLGFRGALCKLYQRTEAIDKARLLGIKKQLQRNVVEHNLIA